MKTTQGNLILNKEKIAIIVSRFNENITSKLLEGSLDCLKRLGHDEANLTIYKVPGAFEIPLILKLVAQKNNYQGIICLGAVIRGETPHFEYVCSEMTKGIASVMLEYSVPVGFGVLTTDNHEQAIDRASGKAGNKGVEATMSTVEMINLINKFKESR